MRERLMAQDIMPRLSNLRSRLSLPAQLGLLGVLILASGVGLLAWRAGERAVAERSESNQPAHAETAAGTFRPTAAQWASLKFRTVTTMAFRRERVTEGNIAIDDDLTTPVFSPYSGRVIKVIAMLGDVLAQGAPLFAIHASEFVQAQNDLITALANLIPARARIGSSPRPICSPRKTPSAATKSRCMRYAAACASSARLTQRSPRSKRSRRRSSTPKRPCRRLSAAPSPNARLANSLRKGNSTERMSKGDRV